MSGTSLDGIDLAFITFTFEKDKWFYKLGACETITYSDYWHGELKNLVNKKNDYIKKIDIKYGKFLAENLNNFILKYDLSIDLICSHGHTIFHQPQKKFTLQIGDGKTISDICRKPVVYNFRDLDVQLGGQGAPLVPVGDHLLFSEYHFCVNLGGFSNISYLKNEKRVAFDISPLNVILNKYANLLGFNYDDQGKIARSGSLIKNLFNDLNKLEYYDNEAPKSLGTEWVNEKFIPVVEKYKEKNNNILRTCLEHFAFQIGKQLKEGNCLFTGGGVLNHFLMERIKFYSNAEIIIPERKLIDYKEALIFGFLGILKLKNQINCYKSVTGASQDSISGQLIDF
jgi:anhydro-N-acetylmuramic acid kinase